MTAPHEHCCATGSSPCSVCSAEVMAALWALLWLWLCSQKGTPAEQWGRGVCGPHKGADREHEYGQVIVWRACRWREGCYGPAEAPG